LVKRAYAPEIKSAFLCPVCAVFYTMHSQLVRHSRLPIAHVEVLECHRLYQFKWWRDVNAWISYLEIRASPAMNRRGSRQPFFSSGQRKRPSRAPGFSFPPGFGPSSIRRAQAIPGPPGRARGLRTREKRGRARSVSERTREPYYLVANPPLPPLVAQSPSAPPLANPPAGCLNSAVPPPTSLYSVVRRAVWLYSAVGQLLPSRLVDTPDRCSSIRLVGHGLGRRGGADVRRDF
jgi:hypothetical protein